MPTGIECFSVRVILRGNLYNWTLSTLGYLDSRIISRRSFHLSLSLSLSVRVISTREIKISTVYAAWKWNFQASTRSNSFHVPVCSFIFPSCGLAYRFFPPPPRRPGDVSLARKDEKDAAEICLAWFIKRRSVLSFPCVYKRAKICRIARQTSDRRTDSPKQ